MDVALGQLLASLPLEERLARYRQFSLEAFQHASSTQDPNLRAGYLSMASGWHVLAGEIERAMDRFDTLRQNHGTPPETHKHS